MKRIGLIAAAAVSVLLVTACSGDAAAAAPAKSWYVGGSIGPGWDNESSLPFVDEDAGLHGAIQIGTWVDDVPGLRLELEATFATHDATVFGVVPLRHDTNAVMVNAVYDFEGLAMGRVVPYAMVGGGAAHTELQLGGIAPLTVENNGFAWQLGAGLNYRVTDSLWLGVGYRHLEAPEVKAFGFELDGGSNDIVEARATLAFN